MPKQLLILEPDDKFSKALKLYFRGTDYEPKILADAEAAFDAATSGSPSAVLLAVDPDDNGAADYVRKMTSGVRCPVIIMSTRKSDKELFPGGVRRLGAADYVKKPFIKDRIVQLLVKVLATPRGGGGAAADLDGGAAGTAVSKLAPAGCSVVLAVLALGTAALATALIWR